MILTKPTQRQAIVLMIVIVLVLAALGLYYILHNQSIPSESSSNPPSNTVAPLLLNDTNWAGYITASDPNNPQPTVTSVGASWTVPTVSVTSNDTFSAIWIGIGGFFDQTLIQIGTEQDSIQGKSEYSAWVELLPQNSITIDTIVVSPGDLIKASIQLVNAANDEWSVQITDLTANQEFSDSFFYPASRLSADWIVERPDVSSPRSRGALTTLADVGKVEFTNCQTKIGNSSGAIGSFPNIQSTMYDNVMNTTDAGVTQLTTVSNFTDDGSSFTVETSPSAIPELSAWMTLLPIMGFLFVLCSCIDACLAAHYSCERVTIWQVIVRLYKVRLKNESHSTSSRGINIKTIRIMRSLKRSLSLK